ncbi:VOC family protein [Wenxinia marina]|uniref:Lactoylglutathione lyase n=1 Tax=Wenxinia marina DSM 24838 TaxID=1123501 RepID=A0A0D0Q6V5_9RHOB|nr:VOC family protein [Wenxinia marina]KIQ68162.1 Lactoylglutathione lyase [Wenxinia marina DSM 24838]GGL76353.1 glyoxalase [Wenxinia marina]
MTNLIARMGYILLAVPDPRASATDLADVLGAGAGGEGADRASLSVSDRAAEIVYLRGETPGVVAVGLEAPDEAAVAEVTSRVRAAGLDILSERPAVDGVTRAVRFATPFGPVLEVHTPVPRTGRPVPGLLRLDHVNLRASDPKGMQDLLADVLGMELSDRTAGYERAWYRAADGFHHTLAVGPGRGIHHYSFQCESAAAIVALADRLGRQGRRLIWGPGRHGPGNNVFSYFADRDGTVCEVCCEMERIDRSAPRQAGVWDMDDPATMNLWGAPMPADYGPMLTEFVPAPS